MNKTISYYLNYRYVQKFHIANKKAITLFIAKSLSVIIVTSVWQILTGIISGSMRMHESKSFDSHFQIFFQKYSINL